MIISRFLLVAGLAVILSGCTAIRPPAYRGASADHLVAGEEATVRQGENLYAFASRHGARLRDVAALNNLTPPFTIRAGQRLVLPAKDRYAAPTPQPAPLEPIDKGYLGPAANGSGGSAGLMGGSVTAEPLAPPPSSSLSSAPLTKPAVTDVPVAPAMDRGPEAAVLAPAARTSNFSTQSVEKPTTDVREVDVSSLSLSSTPKAEPPTVPAAEPLAEKAETSAASTSFPTFGWPVRGTIISAFGPKGKGLDNDGINIAAPKGSPVKAAEGGMVAYAGNEMKGFGNLVLIRHEGGWVTAYAHLDRLVVAKDAIVAKGEMIGTVGTSGGVSSPQLHFEARRDGKPTDPELVLK